MRACWCSAIYNPEPRVLEGTLASQRGVTWIVNFEVLQNHNKLDRRSWLLWLIAKTIHNDANILANNTSTLLWATLKKEFSPQKNLVTKYKEISIFFWCRYTAPSSVIFLVLTKKALLMFGGRYAYWSVNRTLSISAPKHQKWYKALLMYGGRYAYCSVNRTLGMSALIH